MLQVKLYINGYTFLRIVFCATAVILIDLPFLCLVGYSHVSFVQTLSSLCSEPIVVFQDCDSSGLFFSKQGTIESLDGTGLACAAVAALPLGEDICQLLFDGKSKKQKTQKSGKSYDTPDLLSASPEVAAEACFHFKVAESIVASGMPHKSSERHLFFGKNLPSCFRGFCSLIGRTELRMMNLESLEVGNRCGCTGAF